jgi:hypothetical protein
VSLGSAPVSDGVPPVSAGVTVESSPGAPGKSCIDRGAVSVGRTIRRFDVSVVSTPR